MGEGLSQEGPIGSYIPTPLPQQKVLTYPSVEQPLIASMPKAMLGPGINRKFQLLNSSSFCRIEGQAWHKSGLGDIKPGKLI